MQPKGPEKKSAKPNHDNSTSGVVDYKKEYELVRKRLSSFTDFNPRPIIETTFGGRILYTNPAADMEFPDLKKKGLRHPYLFNFKHLATPLKKGEKSLIREVNIKSKWFRQNIYHISSFNLIRIFGLDITDKKQVEDDLKKSEGRYHLLFEKMHYGYALQDIIFDKNKKPVDYRFVDVNPAFEKLSKLKKDDLIGKTTNIISQNPKTKESIKTRKQYDRVALTGKPLYLENYDEKAKKYFELYLYKPNNHQIALIFSDITNRKKTDEEKNNFISIMSHELRNPLTPIMANAQFISSLLKNQKINKLMIQDSIDVIEKQSKMMAGLLNDILDVSKLSRQKIQLKKSRINICEVIKNSVASSMPFIDTKNQKLSIFFGQDQIYMQADPVRMEQIMVNIINNASKYTKPRGHIVVRVNLKNGVITISIQDNGIGMSAQKITGIFELFSDDSQPFMGIGGLGIGLNIVKNLVSMHGGKISVISEGENKGSEFIITFPASKKNSTIKKLAPVKKETSADPGKKYKKVLVVDDNEDIIDAISKILRLAGYQIKTANTGLKAVNIAKTFAPDVALIDIGLPDISGYEVATMIRQHYHKQHKKIKLIASTGYGQQKDKNLSKEAGFDYHLTKPIDFGKLMQVL